MIKEITKTLDKFDLKYDSGSMSVDEIKDYINKKIPVLILLQAWGKNKNIDYTDHYDSGYWVVAIGYDREKIFFEDPYSFKRTFLERGEMELRWHGKEGREKFKNFGIAVYGKEQTYNSKEIIHMD